MSDDTKGYITTQHTVWCGVCSHWDQMSGTKAHLIHVAKKNGWTLTKKHGWRCPSCSKKPEAS